MSDSVQGTADRKRKRPPSFVHLPRDRAKKLKKDWVESKKVKAAWRVEKKRMGLPIGSGTRDEPKDAATIGNANDQDSNWRGISRDDEKDDSDSVEKSQSDAASSRSVSLDPAPPAPQRKSRPNRPPQPPQHDKQPQKSQHSNSMIKQKHPARSRPGQSKRDEQDPTESLRELGRQAYASSSLHHHKADPLGKRRQQGHQHRGGGIGRGRGRGGGRSVGRSGGQPDMGLRMKHLVEQIKSRH